MTIVYQTECFWHTTQDMGSEQSAFKISVYCSKKSRSTYPKAGVVYRTSLRAHFSCTDHARIEMKRLIFATLLICIITPKAIGQETVRFAIGEWEPFYSEKYKHYGLVPHILSEAFALEGIKVEFGFFPWSRSMALVKQGMWDATCCWSKTDERAKYYLFSENVIGEKQVFFHLKEYSFDWHTMHSLKKIRIGTSPDFYHGDAFHAAEQAGEIFVERVTRLAQNFDKLLARRIDIFPMDEIAGYATIHKIFKPEDAEKFTHHPRVLDSMAQRALFSKKIDQSKRMAALLNRGLENLVSSGRYQQLQIDFQKGKYFQ